MTKDLTPTCQRCGEPTAGGVCIACGHIEPKDSTPRRFQPWRPVVQGRANVTEPLNPRILVPLLPLDDLNGPRAAMELTVPQALELAANLIAATQQFIQRRDVSDALRRTEPLLHV